MKKGLIFDIKKYAIHDGPGIRTTVFFKGCPLKCSWCANPESQIISKEFVFWPEKCLHCDACIQVCKLEAIKSFGNEKIIYDGKCNFCGKCVQNCYSEALQIIGREITVEEVVNEIEKDKSFYFESDGGVTFSGGEPLFQAEFLHETLEACKGRNLHTTIDTCGFAPWSVLKKIGNLVDLFLYDIKMIDGKMHKRYTGVSNTLILSNLEKLAQDHHVIVRMPLIPQVNNDIDSIRQIGEYLSKLKKIEEINILPYHKLGINKYNRLLLKYNLDHLRAPTQEEINEVFGVLSEFGFRLKIGG